MELEAYGPQVYANAQARRAKYDDELWIYEYAFVHWIYWVGM